MKPSHPVELLACAIATQEGWFLPGSKPSLRNNPGDLRLADQIGASVPIGVSEPRPIAQFASQALGTTALFRQVWLQVAEGQTVRQIVNQWAPASENDSTAYLQNVLHWTGLPADVPVLELLPALVPLN